MAIRSPTELILCQRGDQTSIGIGQNALLNLSEPCFRCGMLQHSMQRARMARLRRRSSILQMHLSRWYISFGNAKIKSSLTVAQIETLPTRNPNVQPLQNVLSVSTAGKNRYLLHFNSLHSLTQWTAGIRLAMFEHSSLHELYTGSLIAGKGKHLNNIRTIMERSKFRTEDWARVRFGAGTPWRRCWCVIEPPDEKEWQKSNKSLKKKSAYERPSLPKGCIKFYDSKKTKKVTPIATITDAYSAYAIYPQSKPLIDQSTLVKVEGRITIHSKPESKTEGFVFVMPEVHPAVSGFEMMLRWLFPVYDIFHLYGRPQRLIADTWDTRGLMFAMPKERRYGYLDIIDVASLIHTQGSANWNEREWRKHLKEMTSKRIGMAAQSRSSANLENVRQARTLSETRRGIQYDEASSVHSRSTSRHQHNQSTDAVFASPRKTTTAPINSSHLAPVQNHHTRSVSESVAYPSPTKGRQNKENHNSSRLSSEYTDMESIQPPPAPPGHRNPFNANGYPNEADPFDSRYSSDSDAQGQQTYPEDIVREVGESTPPAPVVVPPTFQHQAGEIPQKRPDARPDLRREKSRMSNGTLSQMVDVNKLANANQNSGGVGQAAGHAAMVAWNNGNSQALPGSDQGPRGVIDQNPNDEEISANQPASQATAVLAADLGHSQISADVRPTPISPMPTENMITRKPITRKPVPSSNPFLSLPIRSQSPDSMSRYSVSSAGSPNYDSPPEDINPSPLPERRRTGVLRTVGDPNLGTANAAESTKVDIPNVDFGTTFTPMLTPGHSRPPTSSGLGGHSPVDQSQTGPTTPLNKSPRDRWTPSDEKRSSYIDRSSPSTHHSRSNSQVWHAGATIGRQSPGPGLTAEEFVQQRAATARMPGGYVPHRSVSSSKVEQSPNKLQKRRDTGARPSSRNSLLIDYSHHLSAREQEHVARMTGGPLINVGERSRTPDPSIGLIGAIEAREQERRNIKEGLAGHMVQEAIAQRQAADRTYGYQPSSVYNPMADTRPNSQWMNSSSSVWGVNPGMATQPYQQWPNQSPNSPSYQQPSRYLQRHSGYFPPQENYGTL